MPVRHAGGNEDVQWLLLLSADIRVYVGCGCSEWDLKYTQQLHAKVIDGCPGPRGEGLASLWLLRELDVLRWQFDEVEGMFVAREILCMPIELRSHPGARIAVVQAGVVVGTENGVACRCAAGQGELSVVGEAQRAAVVARVSRGIVRVEGDEVCSYPGRVSLGKAPEGTLFIAEVDERIVFQYGRHFRGLEGEPTGPIDVVGVSGRFVVSADGVVWRMQWDGSRLQLSEVRHMDGASAVVGLGDWVVAIMTHIVCYVVLAGKDTVVELGVFRRMCLAQGQLLADGVGVLLGVRVVPVCSHDVGRQAGGVHGFRLAGKDYVAVVGRRSRIDLVRLDPGGFSSNTVEGFDSKKAGLIAVHVAVGGRREALIQVWRRAWAVAVVGEPARAFSGSPAADVTSTASTANVMLVACGKEVWQLVVGEDGEDATDRMRMEDVVSALAVSTDGDLMAFDLGGEEEPGLGISRVSSDEAARQRVASGRLPSCAVSLAMVGRVVVVALKSGAVVTLRVKEEVGVMEQVSVFNPAGPRDPVRLLSMADGAVLVTGCRPALFSRGVVRPLALGTGLFAALPDGFVRMTDQTLESFRIIADCEVSVTESFRFDMARVIPGAAGVAPPLAVVRGSILEVRNVGVLEARFSRDFGRPILCLDTGANVAAVGAVGGIWLACSVGNNWVLHQVSFEGPVGALCCVGSEVVAFGPHETAGVRMGGRIWSEEASIVGPRCGIGVGELGYVAGRDGVFAVRRGGSRANRKVFALSGSGVCLGERAGCDALGNVFGYDGWAFNVGQPVTGVASFAGDKITVYATAGGIGAIVRLPPRETEWGAFRYRAVRLLRAVELEVGGVIRELTGCDPGEAKSRYFPAGCVINMDVVGRFAMLAATRRVAIAERIARLLDVPIGDFEDLVEQQIEAVHPYFWDVPGPVG